MRLQACITKIPQFLYHKYLIRVALTILPYLYINTICKKRIFTVHISLLNEVKLSIMQEVRRKFVRKCMKRRNEKCFSNNNIEIRNMHNIISHTLSILVNTSCFLFTTKVGSVSCFYCCTITSQYEIRIW